jgi:hypothetical protein
MHGFQPNKTGFDALTRTLGFICAFSRRVALRSSPRNGAAASRLAGALARRWVDVPASSGSSVEPYSCIK